MIFEKVKTIIAEQLNIAEDKITLETSLINDINADSLDLFQIISNMEDAFNIEFPHDVVSGMQTVGDAVEYIKAKTE